MARVKLVADTMVWRNSDIFKLERDNIYAWTHRSGLRLYAFTDAGQILMATNGGDPQGKQNKKQQTKDIETAIKRRAEYFSAKTKGPIPTDEKS